MAEASPQREQPSIDELAESLEFGPRRLSGTSKWLVSIIAASWSVFQLLLPYFLTLNSDIVRTIHLVFAIALVYLCFPAVRKRQLTGVWRIFSQWRGIPWLDVVLAVLAAGCASYYALNYEALAARPGMPLTRDVVVGIALVVLLLEAARRSLGPALPCVALGFIAICFMGPNLPRFLAFKRISLDQLLGQLTMSTEGIYGIPLYVSASMVFLFVLLGAMLEKSGGGKYFVDLAFCLLGPFRGGPAKAAVLASGLTGLVSGSSIANTVTTGTFTIPLMKKSGYPPEKAAAVEVAASTNGQLMPPIMGAAAFIIAERCHMPYLAVVRAAFVPAVVSYIALIYITHLEACKLGLEGIPRADLPRFGRVFLGGIHFLIPLFVLLALLIQRFSPEFAAFWAIVTMAALIMVRAQVVALRSRSSHGAAFREGLAVIWDSLVAGGRNMMTIGVAVAAAGIVVGVMTLGPGSLVTQVIDKLSGGNLVLMLLMTAVISLLLGMGLPTTANYIVVSTLVVPAILTLGNQAGLVVPLITAHLFCFFFGILADDTPPVGLAAYAASAIAESDPIKTGVQGFYYDLRTAILPFMFFFNEELLLLGVHSPLRMVFVFVCALIAMCSFAAVTQQFFLLKLNLAESGALTVVMILLLRPGIVADRYPTSTVTLQLAALVLWGGVYAQQWWRRRRAAGAQIQ